MVLLKYESQTLERGNKLLAARSDRIDELMLKDPAYFKKMATEAEKNANTYDADFDLSMIEHEKEKKAMAAAKTGRK